MKPVFSRFLIILCLLSVLTACSIINPATGDIAKTSAFETALQSVIQSITPPVPSATPVILTSPTMPLPSSTPESEITAPPPTLTSPPIPTETEPDQPVYSDARDKIHSRMQFYGYVQEDQLTDAYWNQMQQRINTYGTTRSILTLEYHGDDYDMYEGRYSMNPSVFSEQIGYLMANDYHFVTMHQAEGFVYGWLELPARSVILTTDISDLHVDSLLSIASTFSDLAAEYGYNPHMLAFIWIGAMDKGDCSDNTCWQQLNQANATGYFTFGSHSTDHRDFGEISPEEGVQDLLNANQVMFDNMGIQAYALAWPFETCSPYPDTIRDLGFTLAWGGTTKPITQNFTAYMDVRPLCLPRLLPPNIEGISMRPDGFTLEQMLESALINP